MNTIKLNTIGTPVKKVAGGSGSGGGNYVYYSGSVDVFNGYPFASIIKVNVGSAILFIPPGMTSFINSFTSENIMGEAFDLSMKISHPLTGEFTTIGKMIAEISKDWTQITEEEFYKIPPVFAIRFSDGTKNYTYEEGMTWGEWLNSEHSKGEFEFMDCGDFQGIKHIDTYGDVSEGPSLVKDSDLISNNKEYICLGAPA